MRTFVTGMVFMAVLIAALYRLMLLTGAFSELENLELANAQAPESLALFEPSSPSVVEEMLNMAGVTRDDVVYDLGCGDGRVVIAAALRGARGVGVDIDPDLIADSRRSAVEANVSHLVQFFREDLIATNVSGASVVMLYLSPAANLLLRPRLLKELKPGTRIVSHCHTMGDWKPDKESAIENHRIYFWTVPADLSGRWRLDISDKYAASRSFLEFRQSYQNVTITLESGNQKIPVSGSRLEGRKLEFTVDGETGSLAGGARFTGEVNGNRAAGKFKTKNLSGTWTARRIKSAE